MIEELLRRAQIYADHAKSEGSLDSALAAIELLAEAIQELDNRTSQE